MVMYTTKYLTDKDHNAFTTLLGGNRNKFNSKWGYNNTLLESLDCFLATAKLKLKENECKGFGREGIKVPVKAISSTAYATIKDLEVRPTSIMLTMSLKEGKEINKLINSVKSNMRKHVVGKFANELMLMDDKMDRRTANKLSKFANNDFPNDLYYFGYKECDPKYGEHYHLVLVFDKSYSARTIHECFVKSKDKFLTDHPHASNGDSRFSPVKKGFTIKEYALHSQSEEAFEHFKYICKEKTKQALTSQPACNIKLSEYRTPTKKVEEHQF
jgi:hypothetical protein